MKIPAYLDAFALLAILRKKDYPDCYQPATARELGEVELPQAILEENFSLARACIDAMEEASLAREKEDKTLLFLPEGDRMKSIHTPEELIAALGYEVDEIEALVAEYLMFTEGATSPAPTKKSTKKVGKTKHPPLWHKACIQLLTDALRIEPVSLYNIRTGKTLIPFVEKDGTLRGYQTAYTPLATLLKAGSFGLPMDAEEYALAHYPAPGSGAKNQMGFLPELATDVKLDGSGEILERSTALTEVLSLLEADFQTYGEKGFSWCIAAPEAIAGKALQITCAEPELYDLAGEAISMQEVKEVPSEMDETKAYRERA